jgi:hypothetical protein
MYLKKNMIIRFKQIITVLLFATVTVTLHAQYSKTAGAKHWDTEKANAWYAKQPWLVGCNFSPSTAINQLEMWQAETFDTATINRELGWAASVGMNNVRVFLHDLLYQQDAAGFIKRMDVFLQIAARHKIKVLFVFFDSVWDPWPYLGKQRNPKPYVHNSGWVQSPGLHALVDNKQHARLEKYVKAVVKYFASDGRILGWDVWNEPDNWNPNSYERYEPKNKVELVYPLLKKTFEWVRSSNPTQPVTSGIWLGDWSSDDKLSPVQKLQIEQSDIITFHNYDSAEEFEKRVNWLKRYNRPLLCTEYMSRGNGSLFEGIVPVAKKYNVAIMNWGLVAGKTNTIYPWDSWLKEYKSEPELWFHDIFWPNGTPYKKSEVDFLKQVTGKQ